jgi:hypothetical protein
LAPIGDHPQVGIADFISKKMLILAECHRRGNRNRHLGDGLRRQVSLGSSGWDRSLRYPASLGSTELQIRVGRRAIGMDVPPGSFRLRTLEMSHGKHKGLAVYLQ